MEVIDILRATPSAASPFRLLGLPFKGLGNLGVILDNLSKITTRLPQRFSKNAEVIFGDILPKKGNWFFVFDFGPNITSAFFEKR